MKMVKYKWTPAIRTMLYEKLVEKFGPFESWGLITNPKGKRNEYKTFCKEMSEALTIITGKKITEGAVEQQIAWAKNPAKQIIAQGYFRSYIDNISIAIQTGFIKTSDLPTTVLLGDYIEKDENNRT